MVDLAHASVDEIRENWQFFVTAIGEVIDRCELDFHPADVYREISLGKPDSPHLFWINHGGETVGLTVVSVSLDRYRARSSLVLDMTYIEPHVDILSDLRDAVDELARSLGVDYIEWYSPRVGWQRVMDRIGYQSSFMCYSREVK